VFLRNVGIYLRAYTASQPCRTTYSEIGPSPSFIHVDCYVGPTGYWRSADFRNVRIVRVTLSYHVFSVTKYLYVYQKLSVCI
jgi:hypothetical protein